MNYVKMITKLSEELELRKYSPRTKNAYVYNVGRYLKWSEKTRKYFTNEHVREYFLSLDLDESSIGQIKASLLFFFRNVLNINLEIFVKMPIKKKKILPKVLSRELIHRLISSTDNLKHKLVIVLLYSSGLRLSEVVNLKRKDIDVDRGMILIRQGKGKKDRQTILSEKAKKLLLKYLCTTKFETDYLFEGRKGKYSHKTIQKILDNSARKAGIKKKISPHMLRHSFATHLLENGTDIRYIQKLLGHSRLSTTQGYAYVAKSDFLKIKSPYD